MTLLPVSVLFVLVGLLSGVFLGPGGLLLGGLAIPILLFVRKICETDDHALRILWLEVLCLRRRRAWRLFGQTLTLAPIRYGRDLLTYRRPFRKSFSQRAG